MIEFVDGKATIKVSQVMEAIEKNGYPWVRRTMETTDGYCAFGQAAKNLFDDNITNYAYQIVDSLNLLGKNYGSQIMHENDDIAETYEEVVVFAKEILAPILDKEITILIEDA